MNRILCAAAATLLAIAPAYARDFCPERPGQATPPCTVEPGHGVIETALASWMLTRDQGTRADSFVFGQTLLRVGVGAATEVQVGFTPFGTVRIRDLGGIVTRAGSAGDTYVAVKHAFGDPDSPVVAVKAYATLPTGGAAIGQGDWSAGVNLPVAFALSDRIGVGLTPEVDLVANGSGNGRHAVYGGAAGLAFTLTDQASLTTDVSVFRDDDPAGGSTAALAGASLAVQASDRLQFDIGGTAGLTAASPDVSIYVGVARRF